MWNAITSEAFSIGTEDKERKHEKIHCIDLTQCNVNAAYKYVDRREYLIHWLLLRLQHAAIQLASKQNRQSLKAQNFHTE
jgi:hypothetical protein